MTVIDACRDTHMPTVVIKRMMLIRLLTAVTLFLAACQSMSPPTPTESNLQNTGVAVQDVRTPQATEEQTPVWMETEVHGVSLGIWKPAGWEADTSYGLLMAEHTVSIETGQAEGGMMINVFVPETHNLEVADSDEHNFAWFVFDQIVDDPAHTGRDVAVSDPVPFSWGGHEAAYYLVSTSDGFEMVIIGIALPGDHDKLVVCNISLPARDARDVRDIIPRLLDSFTINGVDLDGTALEALPDPLEFPNYGHS